MIGSRGEAWTGKTKLGAIKIVRSRVRRVNGGVPHNVPQGASFGRPVEPQDIKSLETVVFTRQASTL